MVVRLVSAIFTCAVAFIFLAGVGTGAAMDILAPAADSAPAVDGSAGDPAWAKAAAVEIKDGRSGDPVTIKTLRSGDSVYFLVQFPDTEENRLHKPWVWNKEMGVYALGTQREDGFTFKWNMGEKDVDLSNFSDDDYHADVWYWKANRTDPAGYSDDKHHVLSSEQTKKSKELTGKGGGKRYLQRLGDKGTSAQEKQLLTDYQGDVQDQYTSRTPDGSRGDVRAKGSWIDGMWTVEFARKLDTGHDDDVKFVPGAGRKYPFGVSIFGLYGEALDDSKVHLYGQGRISEPLFLVFP